MNVSKNGKNPLFLAFFKLFGSAFPKKAQKYPIVNAIIVQYSIITQIPQMSIGFCEKVKNFFTLVSV